jgi:hypothetical protein
MSSQKLQDSLNQMSLVMTTSEEIMTACKKGEVHPLLAEVLVKLWIEWLRLRLQVMPPLQQLPNVVASTFLTWLDQRELKDDTIVYS